MVRTVDVFDPCVEDRHPARVEVIEAHAEARDPHRVDVGGDRARETARGEEVVDHGRLLLARARIPAAFPAILRRAGPRAPIYYFAGDFADNRFVPSWTHYRGAAVTARWMPATLQSVTNLFYWRVYLPVIETVMDAVSIPEEQLAWSRDSAGHV